jgi:hypothetical protein
LADGRKRGFKLAVRFLENYLKANGDMIELSRDEALAFDDVRKAMQINIRRFWQDNLIGPKSTAPGANEAVGAITKDPEEKVQRFADHWVRAIPSRAVLNELRSMFGGNVDPQSGSIGFGPGGSNLTSSGSFELQRNGNRIAATVTVTHVWSDAGYIFESTDPFYDESRILERHKKAKPFQWRAEWDDIITGELEIVNPFSANAWLRGINLEVNRLVFDMSP